MENDNWGLALVFLGVMLTIGGFTFGGYTLGKIHEREALTAALVEQIEEAYWAGHGDASKSCGDNHQ